MLLRKIISVVLLSMTVLFSLSVTGIAAAQIVVGYAAPSLDGGQKQIFDGFRICEGFIYNLRIGLNS